MLDSLAQIFGWLHPATAHFPIAGSILALLALLSGKGSRQDWLLKGAGALWIVTFLTALPCLALGHLFAHHLGLMSRWTLFPPASASKGDLLTHAILGTSGLVLSAVAFFGAIRLFQGKPWPFTLQLVLGLLVAGLFGATGHEGGEMVFGDDDAPAASSPATAASPAPSAPASPAPKRTADLLQEARGYSTRLVKMNTKPWISRTHGGRWVNTFVSPGAVKAYQNEDTLPAGSLVVKESFEDQGGKPSTVSGPLYVMKKGADGTWRYALQWDKPVKGNPEGITAPTTRLPGDPGLNSCVRCHDHFHGSDLMGGVPDEVAVK